MLIISRHWSFLKCMYVMLPALILFEIHMYEGLPCFSANSYLKYMYMMFLALILFEMHVMMFLLLFVSWNPFVNVPNTDFRFEFMYVMFSPVPALIFLFEIMYEGLPCFNANSCDDESYYSSCKSDLECLYIILTNSYSALESCVKIKTTFQCGCYHWFQS